MAELTQIDSFKPLHRTLLELGLSDREATLYVTALRSGPILVSRLSLALGIDRPNTYKLIKELESRGLVQFSNGKGYNRRLSVESPSKVIELLRAKKQSIDNIDREVTEVMPDILAQFKQGQLASKVKIIQGKKGFLELFFQTLDEEKGELKWFGSAEDIVSFISWTEERRWIKKRVQNNQKINVLLLPSATVDELAKSNKEDLREIRILKYVKPFVSSFQPFANKVILWQPRAPLAILIEDEYIAKMFNAIFDSWWEMSYEK